MSVIYTVTEADGFQHTRTSRAENAQKYFWAVVMVPHGAKRHVTYSSRRDLAERLLANAKAHTYQGRHTYPDAALYPVTAVVK